MTKAQIKIGTFYLAYTALMGVFLFLLMDLLPEQYYILKDYAYWRVNFTPFPPYNLPKSPEIWEYFDVSFSLILCTIPLIYNAYLILKRKNKKNGLILLLSVAVLFYLYGLLKCKFWAFCG